MYKYDHSRPEQQERPTKRVKREERCHVRIPLKQSNFHEHRKQQLLDRIRFVPQQDNIGNDDHVTFEELYPVLDDRQPVFSPQIIDGCIAGIFDSCSPVHGMLDALHTAFSQELGFVLDPVHVWICITQAISCRIQQDPKLFHKILGIQTKHADEKETIAVRNDSLDIHGSVERETSKWATVFPDFQRQISQKMTSMWASQCCTELSTSTDVSSLVQSMTLMASVQHYFNYEVFTMCGISFVDLVGTQQDWNKLAHLVREMRTKTFAALRDAFFHKWLTYLEMVLHQITSTYTSTPAYHFWKSMYKYESQSGTDTIDGWCLLLFPYGCNGQPRIQLMHQAHAHRYVQKMDTNELGAFATGLNTVPFTWDYFGHRIPLQMVSGFQKPTVVNRDGQDEEPIILPCLGWMIVVHERDRDKWNKTRSLFPIPEPVQELVQEPIVKLQQSVQELVQEPVTQESKHELNQKPPVQDYAFHNNKAHVISIDKQEKSNDDNKAREKSINENKNPGIEIQEPGNGRSFLILPDNTFQVVHAKGDYARMRLYLKGPAGKIPIRDNQHHVFDLWCNDECNVDPNCETNNLGFYVVDACNGAVESFYPYGLTGPILVTAKGTCSSLSDKDIEHLAQYCTNLNKNQCSEGATRTFQKQIGLFTMDSMVTLPYNIE
jgi:hypothetical protein